MHSPNLEAEIRDAKYYTDPNQKEARFKGSGYEVWMNGEYASLKKGGESVAFYKVGYGVEIRNSNLSESEIINLMKNIIKTQNQFYPEKSKEENTKGITTKKKIKKKVIYTKPLVGIDEILKALNGETRTFSGKDKYGVAYEITTASDKQLTVKSDGEELKQDDFVLSVAAQIMLNKLLEGKEVLYIRENVIPLIVDGKWGKKTDAAYTYFNKNKVSVLESTPKIEESKEEEKKDVKKNVEKEETKTDTEKKKKEIPDGTAVNYEKTFNRSDTTTKTDAYILLTGWIKDLDNMTTNEQKLYNAVWYQMLGRGWDPTKVTFDKLDGIVKSQGLELTAESRLLCIWDGTRSLLAESMLGEKVGKKTVKAGGVRFWNGNFEVIISSVSKQEEKPEVMKDGEIKRYQEKINRPDGNYTYNGKNYDLTDNKICQDEKEVTGIDRKDFETNADKVVEQVIIDIEDDKKEMEEVTSSDVAVQNALLINLTKVGTISIDTEKTVIGNIFKETSVLNEDGSVNENFITSYFAGGKKFGDMTLEEFTTAVGKNDISNEAVAYLLEERVIQRLYELGVLVPSGKVGYKKTHLALSPEANLDEDQIKQVNAYLDKYNARGSEPGKNVLLLFGLQDGKVLSKGERVIDFLSAVASKQDVKKLIEPEKNEEGKKNDEKKEETGQELVVKLNEDIQLLIDKIGEKKITTNAEKKELEANIGELGEKVKEIGNKETKALFRTLKSKAKAKIADFDKAQEENKPKKEDAGYVKLQADVKTEMDRAEELLKIEIDPAKSAEITGSQSLLTMKQKIDKKIKEKQELTQADLTAMKDANDKYEKLINYKIDKNEDIVEINGDHLKNEYAYANELAGIESVKWAHDLLSANFDEVKKACVTAGIPEDKVSGAIQDFVSGVKSDSILQGMLQNYGENAITDLANAISVHAGYEK